MIAKCIAVLAVVAQIGASVSIGCGLSSVFVQNGGSGSSPVVLVSSGNSGSTAFGDFSSGITRNLVGKGKWPVALSSSGPVPDQQIPVTTSRLTIPVQEKPTVRLPARIPGPKTVAHSCTCYKTILRPRVHQQIITVPTVQRYVETSHKPVLENIHYEALPVNSGTGIQFVGSDSSSGSVGLVDSCGSQIEIPTVPRVQVVEAQVPQSVSLGSC